MDIPDTIDGIPIDEYQVSMVKMPKDELEKLYLEQHKSVKEIARHFKCSYRTVYRRLHRLGIELNKESRKKKPRHVLGKNELIELLRKDLTIDQIAKKLRTEPHIVRRFIQKYGI